MYGLSKPLKLLVHDAQRISKHCKNVTVWIAMPCHTVSGDIMLELVLDSDAVLRLYELPAHATWPLKWVCSQMILAVGVQVPDNNDSGHEA